MKKLSDESMTNVQCGFNWSAFGSTDCISCGVALAGLGLTVYAIIQTGGLAAIAAALKKGTAAEIQAALLKILGVSIDITGSILSCGPCYDNLVSE